MTRQIFLHAIRCRRLICGETKLIDDFVVVLAIAILTALLIGYDAVIMGGM